MMWTLRRPEYRRHLFLLALLMLLALMLMRRPATRDGLATESGSAAVRRAVATSVGAHTGPPVLADAH